MATNICGDDGWLLRQYLDQSARAFKYWKDQNSLRNKDLLIGLLTTVHCGPNENSEGYGSLLVSNLFRKRFPFSRYNTGDIGRWVEIDGIPYLELKGRESRSFIIKT